MNGEDGSDATVLREIEERIRSRLAVVERHNEQLRRRTRLLGLGLLVTAALVALIAVAPDSLAVVGLGSSEDVLTARGFRLVDDNGLRRGELSVDEEGRARLTLLDTQQRERLNVSVLESGSPGISLVNSRGNRRAVFGLLPDETVNLLFADADGVPRVQVGMTPQDGSHLLLADENGAPRLGLVLDAAGMGSVLFPDSAASGDNDSGGGSP